MTKLETKGLKRMLFAAVALLLGAGVHAHAAPVTFDFNSLSAGANSATIQTYMQGVLNTTYGNGVVTVAVSGAIADKGSTQTNILQWSGDGHTVGGSTPNTTPKSITLGTSNNCSGSGCAAGGADDAYIRNDSLGLAGPTSDVITMTFTGASFSQASFDWEVFPDVSCTAADGVHCGGAGNPNVPDLIFKAGGNTVTTLSGVTPGTAGTYSRSPLGAETAPQAIGTGSWAFASASTFQFVDWPATIGVDNLTFTPPPSSVPEPGSVALLVTTVIGCYFLLQRRRKA